MARPANPQRTADLLDAAARVVERDGLSGITLRPLAAELGVAPRTLLYHFGSKEQLLARVLRHLRSRHTELSGILAGATAQTGDVAADLVEAIERLSTEAKQPVLRPFFALYFELAALTIRDPDRYHSVFVDIEQDWLGLIVPRLTAAGVPADRATLIADVVLSGYRGALHMALTTGRWHEADQIIEILKLTARQLVAPGGGASLDGR
ncbi:MULTISPECIES: TetR/AcrR family transcriptional regulator [unclassified Micromonospora]|uniref:TetR/AcrR family transcriptional regulator n=1 Tax=unclassified Micromonospora TaxID=2617518 RepID=UPI003329FCCF